MVTAAVLVGMPISLLLTPIIFALVIITTKLVSLVIAVPMAVWNLYDAVLSIPITAFDGTGRLPWTMWFR